MARIGWRIEGHDLSNCNCAFGCPCQFNALPTFGHCHAGVAFHVVRGHFGNVPLDGLSFGGLFAWPGPIHEGRGEAQPVIDIRASAAQREALLKIMSGEETEPGATIFQVFSTTYVKVHEPIFTAIRFAFDPSKAEAHVVFEGLATFGAEPIRNAVTGAVHRPRVVLQEGFEFTEAEFASGHMRTDPRSPIPLNWESRHSHLARIAMTGQGLVRA